jgi:HPt (histidine-containing phosphotransfer) domain-containing protein
MTEVRDPSIDALLAAARVQFAASLPAKVQEMHALAASESWDTLRRAAHRLRGSAATYGYPALGALAAAVEEALIAAGGPPDAQARAAIDRSLADAGAAAQHAAAEAP